MDKPGFIVPPPGLFPVDDDRSDARDSGSPASARAAAAPPAVTPMPGELPPVEATRNAAAFPAVDTRIAPPAGAATPAPAGGPTGTPAAAPPSMMTIPAFLPAPLGTIPVPPRAAPAAPITPPAAITPPAPSPAASGASPASAAAPPTAPQAITPAMPPVGPPAEAASGWTLRLADGQAVAVTGSLVLGRDPAPVTRRAATMVSVQDPALSVSKSHALVELSASGELTVTDLHSTNGVSLSDAAGQRVPLEPGIRTVLGDGARLLLGEFAVVASRA
ncbi:FHA domain-containing protein [Cryobacterium arcticum]|uniref:FHA domain-containing protein n=1 Tax=Cryobacterium arcticum TaxID=670052 RepID=A0A1B1BKD2_9MICO|nr:FHA domain-containing protein [Cryobacterium arcticum]